MKPLSKSIRIVKGDLTWQVQKITLARRIKTTKKYSVSVLGYDFMVWLCG